MRAPPIASIDIEPSQRDLYDAFVNRIRTNYSGLKAIRSDGALLGPWSVWINVPETGAAIRQLTESVGAMPGLSKVAVQAVTLVTVAHFNAAYELYVHAALGAQAGLSSEQVATLAAGDIPANLDPETAVAVRVANTLLRGGVLPGPLYSHAVERLGRDGFNRVVFLVGVYCLVSVTLGAFDVPSEDQ